MLISLYSSQTEYSYSYSTAKTGGNDNTYYNTSPQITTPKISTSGSFKVTDGCRFESDNGVVYDLSALRKLTDYTFQMNYYTYKANFCGPLVDKCNGSNSPAAAFHSQSICLGVLSNSWTNISADYLEKDLHNAGVKLMFNELGGQCSNSFTEKNSLLFTIKCDETINEAILESIRKVNSCTYDIVFVSKHGCPIYTWSKTNPRFILLCIGILFSVYLIFFTFMNYRESPEDGLIKALPHKDFWAYFLECYVEGWKVSIEVIKSKFKPKNDYDNF